MTVYAIFFEIRRKRNTDFLQILSKNSVGIRNRPQDENRVLRVLCKIIISKLNYKIIGFTIAGDRQYLRYLKNINKERDNSVFFMYPNDGK